MIINGEKYLQMLIFIVISKQGINMIRSSSGHSWRSIFGRSSVTMMGCFGGIRSHHKGILIHGYTHSWSFLVIFQTGDNFSLNNEVNSDFEFDTFLYYEFLKLKIYYNSYINNGLGNIKNVSIFKLFLITNKHTNFVEIFINHYQMQENFNDMGAIKKLTSEYWPFTT